MVKKWTHIVVLRKIKRLIYLRKVLLPTGTDVPPHRCSWTWIWLRKDRCILVLSAFVGCTNWVLTFHVWAGCLVNVLVDHKVFLLSVQGGCWVDVHEVFYLSTLQGCHRESLHSLLPQHTEKGTLKESLCTKSSISAHCKDTMENHRTIFYRGILQRHTKRKVAQSSVSGLRKLWGQLERIMKHSLLPRYTRRTALMNHCSQSFMQAHCESIVSKSLHKKSSASAHCKNTMRESLYKVYLKYHKGILKEPLYIKSSTSAHCKNTMRESLCKVYLRIPQRHTKSTFVHSLLPQHTARTSLEDHYTQSLQAHWKNNCAQSPHFSFHPIARTLPKKQCKRQNGCFTQHAKRNNGDNNTKWRSEPSMFSFLCHF